MKKLKFDVGLCIGCGACAAVSPDHFEKNVATGKARLRREGVVDDTGEMLVSVCPGQAITTK